MKTIRILLSLLLLISCKKENSKRWTEITIKVNNYITGAPIDKNVVCGVVYYKNYKSPLKKDADIVLDAGAPINGVYHFGFKAPKTIQWAEFDWNSDSLYGVNVNQFMYYKVGEKNEFQQYLVPMGHLRTSYKNLNCFDDNDEVLFYYIKNIDIPDFINTGSGNPLIGCDIDIASPYVGFPIGFYEYKWSYTKNGITNIEVDTIEVKVNEFTTVNMQY